MKISFAVLTISDRSYFDERPDESGKILSDLIELNKWITKYKKIIPDDYGIIKSTLGLFCYSFPVDVLLTTGGTGFSPRDNTPEATLEVIQKPTPGISEIIRSESMKLTPHAMLSRAVSGITNKTLIINLPGSPKAVSEDFKVISPVLPHAIELLRNISASDSSHIFTDRH